ncbi:TetR/AcrR family transcriptional regulator [Streptomyces sp. NPDC088400]|uniref:TetR/AcrR family transcriptional regulator n=1 Tax=Streptomyces sp. NPDC088400 TaxID=3365861 RepID=UPI0037F94F5D
MPCSTVPTRANSPTRTSSWPGRSATPREAPWETRPRPEIRTRLRSVREDTTGAQLDVSREASRLFWAQGVDATSGDQIAEAVGLSTRTIWRHFRSKESCAEPIVTQGVEWEMSTLHSWPPQLSLEVHFAAESNRFGREASDVERMDTALAVKMIRLADTEPAIRTAWLMACDQVEREMAEIIAQRLRLPAEDLDVRLHAAAASAALRVLNENIGAAILGGRRPPGLRRRPCPDRASGTQGHRRSRGGSCHHLSDDNRPRTGRRVRGDTCPDGRSPDDGATPCPGTGRRRPARRT